MRSTKHGNVPAVYADALATVVRYELGRPFGSTMKARAPLTGRAKRRFAVTTQFVEENLHRKIALGDLAAMVSLSVSQFAHAFKSEYGVSPYRYVIVRRIERAKTLLGTTDHNIASIAQRVGFTSQAKLSETFGKIVGVTPSVYRHAGPAPPSDALQ
jgi:AraC family transcriptional regulator